MTVVNTWDDETNLVIEASGHATGNQDVCSAISALLLSFKAYLDAYGESFSIQQSDAYLKIVCNSSEMTDPAFNMIVCGLRAMQDSYPEYLQLLEGHLTL